MSVKSTIDQLLRSLAKAANALAGAGIPFAVAGGFAVYARGGPPSTHDVDLFVRPQDVQHAEEVLVQAGLRASRPPENWLTKVYDGHHLIDIIFSPNGRDVTDELLDRAENLRVGATSARVISATDLMIDKLLVLDAHRLDFVRLLEIARALREQVDWPSVAEQTEQSPYARSFLALIADLAISSSHPPRESPNPTSPAATVRRALAEDERAGELGVFVADQGPDSVRLNGSVATPARREELERIAKESLPGGHVANQIVVASYDEPHSEEVVD